MFEKPFVRVLLIIAAALILTLAIILIINPSLIYSVKVGEPIITYEEVSSKTIINSDYLEESSEEEPKKLPCKCTEEELNKTYTFDLKEYEEDLKNFNENKNVGTIKGHDDALKKAKKLWEEMFKDEIDLEANCGIFVAYDKNSDCWYVYSKTYDYEESDTWMVFDDSQLNFIAQSDGKVLASWVG